MEWTVEKITKSDLHPGDHIYMPGSMSQSAKNIGLCTFYHHGIYIGRNVQGVEEVTDFGATQKSKPVIRKLTDFLGTNGNKCLYRRNYISTTLPPEETIEMCKVVCSGQFKWPYYHLWKNNCEHYIMYLKTGVKYSYQIHKLIKWLKSVIVYMISTVFITFSVIRCDMCLL